MNFVAIRRDLLKHKRLWLSDTLKFGGLVGFVGAWITVQTWAPPMLHFMTAVVR